MKHAVKIYHNDVLMIPVALFSSETKALDFLRKKYEEIFGEPFSSFQVMDIITDFITEESFDADNFYSFHLETLSVN